MKDGEDKAFQDYLASGGKLLVMADALLSDGDFQLEMGLSYVGPPEYDCDYLLPVGNDAPLCAPMLCYFPGHRVNAPQAEVLAELITPYFSRTYGHFCGHKNTPHNKNAVRLPAIVKNGNVVYLAHDLAKNYYTKGSVYHKRWFMQALRSVFEPNLSVTGLGAQGRCTMICQPEQRRFCINMVYAAPVRRGEAEIIEDVLPIYRIAVRLKTDRRITDVYLPLSGETLSFSQDGDEISFTVPELNCHTTIVLKY